MPDPITAQPVVDDAYWFAYSKELVEKAITSRNEQAARFQSLIVWLWGIYTASAAVGLTLGKANLETWVKVVIALPSLFLIFAYWAAVQAQTPPEMQFDPRSPTQIMKAYAHGVSQKKKLLGWAKFLSVFSGLLVGIALISASLGKQTDKQITIPEFNAKRKEALLTVWGRGIDCKDAIEISVIPKASASVNPIKNIVPCRPNGEFGTELKLSPEWKSGLLSKIEWIDSKAVSHTMARELE